MKCVYKIINIINEFISVRQAAEYLKLNKRLVYKKNRKPRKVYDTQGIKRCLWKRGLHQMDSNGNIKTRYNTI